LRLARGCEDGPLVGFQDPQPGLKILGVILARFGAESQVRASERGPQFCYQFFSRIGVVAEPLP